MQLQMIVFSHCRKNERKTSGHWTLTSEDTPGLQKLTNCVMTSMSRNSFIKHVSKKSVTSPGVSWVSKRFMLSMTVRLMQHSSEVLCFSLSTFTSSAVEETRPHTEENNTAATSAGLCWGHEPEMRHLYVSVRSLKEKLMLLRKLKLRGSSSSSTPTVDYSSSTVLGRFCFFFSTFIKNRFSTSLPPIGVEWSFEKMHFIQQTN